MTMTKIKSHEAVEGIVFYEPHWVCYHLFFPMVESFDWQVFNRQLVCILLGLVMLNLVHMVPPNLQFRTAMAIIF